MVNSVVLEVQAEALPARKPTQAERVSRELNLAKPALVLAAHPRLPAERKLELASQASAVQVLWAGLADSVVDLVGPAASAVLAVRRRCRLPRSRSA